MLVLVNNRKFEKRCLWVRGNAMYWLEDSSGKKRSMNMMLKNDYCLGLVLNVFLWISHRSNVVAIIIQFKVEICSACWCQCKELAKSSFQRPSKAFRLTRCPFMLGKANRVPLSIHMFDLYLIKSFKRYTCYINPLQVFWIPFIHALTRTVVSFSL